MTLVQSHLTSGRAGQFFMTHSLHRVTQRSLTCNFQAGQEFTELETCDMTILHESFRQARTPNSIHEHFNMQFSGRAGIH